MGVRVGAQENRSKLMQNESFLTFAFFFTTRTPGRGGHRIEAKTKSRLEQWGKSANLLAQKNNAFCSQQPSNHPEPSDFLPHTYLQTKTVVSSPSTAPPFTARRSGCSLARVCANSLKAGTICWHIPHLPGKVATLIHRHFEHV